MDIIAIRCINFNKETCLYLRKSKIEEMITKIMLNEVLHHVDMLWIICSNKDMLYGIDKSNHPDWLNKGPWYNTYICSKLHGKMFGGFITNARTDRYNLMCSIVAHDKKQPSYEY